ncbi:MAG: response regulator transcription factor [Bacteroidetes bacterium]|nr:MAG: response regulator transcription factor [Bacteroidota bacterium]
MIKAITVDDEPDAHVVLKKLLEKCPQKVNIIDSAHSLGSASSLILRHKPELVFLDIEMPGGSGFDLLNKFNPPSFEIIFTTAHERYAIKAFKCAAIDYLLKPIHLSDLQGALSRYEDNRKLLLKENKFQVLLDNTGTNPYQFHKLALPSASAYEMVNLKDIVYCKAEGNYTAVQLINDKQIFVTKLIKWFEEMLPPQTFFRIHKSYIVNLNLMTKIERNEGAVIMQNGARLYIAERIKKDFYTAILSHNR